jgi:nucleoside-diphosphate-sugar epimerase
MKVLVTGGSGFIGTNLIERLISQGHQILNIDIAVPKISQHKSFWREVDINVLDDLNICIKSFEPDYIVHLAARVDLDGKEIRDYATNVLGVENLLKCTFNLDSLKKILITSSMLVCDVGYKPMDQFDYSPATVYGKSKVQTEELVWQNRPKCDWAIIRPTSIWGPWFGLPYKSFFDMILSKKYFHIGNKGCVKSYGYIGNSVCQIEKILFSNTFDDLKKIYYIGDNPPINIEEWANEIADEVGFKIVKLPYFIIKFLALLGDTLKLMKVNFPMNSFRLRNMTTNNIIDLKDTYELLENLPYTRRDGIKKTLNWIYENKKE